MRIVCFERDGRASIGAVAGDGVVDLAELVSEPSPQAMLEGLIDGWGDLPDAIAELCRTRTAHPREAITLRASVPAPGKVLCVMRNRPALAESTAPPWAYLKYAGGGVGPDGTLRRPVGDGALRLQPEVAVVLRGPARNLAPKDWREAVFGYTGFIDVVRPGSAFGSGGSDDWWKSWDTAFAVGPEIVIGDGEGHPGRGVGLEVTGAAGTVSAQDPGEPPIGEIIAFLSSVMTLRTGDLLACGAHESATLAAEPAGRARLTLDGCEALRVQVAA